MTDSLERFTRTSQAVAARVIAAYSTSFGVATRLLGQRHRGHVRNIYAMVRVADEIVDGVCADVGLDASAQRQQLRAYAAEAGRAMDIGYSNDLVLHAFAHTARASGITRELTDPFFDSMEEDLENQESSPVKTYDARDYNRYVYGSAEVVGLMCLKVFLREEVRSQDQLKKLEYGARQLGAAFQGVNFLRDLADDTDRLHRSYLTVQAELTEEAKQEWVNRIRNQLADAGEAVPLLPKDARAAVRAALGLFEQLNNRVERTPVAELYRRRVRVPDSAKGLVAAKAVMRAYREAQT